VVAGRTAPTQGVTVIRREDQYFDDIRFSSVIVPEPAAFWILGTSIGCLAWRARRRQGN